MVTFRRIALALAIILGSTAHSEPRILPIVPPSPADVAYRLYAGCIRAHFMSATIDVKTKQEVAEYIAELDTQCLMWMLIWYPPLMNESFQDVPAYVIRQFKTLREYAIAQASEEIILALNIKK